MMQPLRRSGVSLWTLLLLCALPENSSTECVVCHNNGTGTFTISTTTVSLVSRPNCTLSTVDKIHGNGSLTGLTSGVVYQIFIECFNCCKEITTKPEVIRNLTVMNVTTSTVSLNWIEPVGNSSLYRVHWTDGRLNGTLNVNETYVHITNLTAGVQNEISVTAVADDGLTGGQSFTVVRYTKPEVIRNLTVMNVTTSTVSLTWTQPVGNSSLYRVHWTDGRLNGTLNVNETYVHITNLTAGVKNEISVTAVADDGLTGGQSFTVVRYTKPEVIRNLTVMNVTTSTVSLTWTQPVGNSSLYRVHWTDGRLNGTLNVNETYVHITNLTAGVKNEISVTAVADDGLTGGQSFTVVRYTKPGVVWPLNVTGITTSSMHVMWSEPMGEHSFYRVNWTGGTRRVPVTDTKINVTGLTAGVHYSFTVVAVAKDNSTESDTAEISHYTKPGIIGLHNVSSNTSSISLRWPAPPGQVFMYRLEWHDGGGLTLTTVPNTFAMLSELTSGTNHNITIFAVAGDNKTQGDPYTFTSFTKPNPVLNVTASPRSTTSVTVTWSSPVEAKPYYKYVIKTYTTTGELVNTTVNSNSADIPDLEPGNKYNISVRAIVESGSESTEEHTMSFTMPKAVTNLTVSDVNTTAIRLTWLRQSDYKPTYSYLVMALQNATEVQENRTGSESYTFSDLRPGNLYTFYVFTYVEEVKSSGENTSNYTRPDSVTRLRQSGITTNAVTLVWEQPNSKTGQSFVVLVTQNYSSFPEAQVFHTTFTSIGLSSGSNTSFTVTTQTTDGTPAAPVTVYYFTRPYSITGLKVETLNTTTGRLVWSEPPEYNSEYKYRVQTTGCSSQNQTVQVNAANISALTPGTNCTFCVFVIAVDGTEGEENCTSQYTEPETVQVSLSSRGSSSSVLVSWTKPPGKVEYFKVYLNSTSSEFKEEVLNSTSNSFRFEGLSAGTLYSARVFTYSGPFNASSEYIRNATVPNPPGSVEVLRKTTSSIEVRWGEAPLMTAPSFFYKLTHTPSQGGGYNTSNTSHTLDSLHSGTSYNISIATVGPMDFESEKVHIYMVTTRPCSITGLKVETLNTTTGRLVWSEPLGNNSEYKYRVQTTGCSSQNQTVQVEAANISALTPGTNCTFCVFVIAVDGTEGEENCTSQYTKPETVQVSLSSQGSNSSVLVSWTKPPGNVEHFKVYLNSTSSTLEEKELSSTSNSSRFEGLSAGTLYSARVSTCSGPFNASSEYIRNATFPNPPGSVKVLRKTTSSIEVRWEEAPLMKAPSFFYKLTHTPSQGGGYNTSNTSHTLDSLHSGTSYNISIATVGPMDFESEKVHIYMVTTRPCSITGLKVETLNTTTGRLVWSKPLGNNSEYKYRVQTTGCSSQNQTVQVEAANISALTPGTNCTFCVFVIAVDGTEGEENCTSQYTKPETVQVSLSSQGSNSSVLVSWTKPPGNVEHFKVYLNSTSSTLEEKELNSTSNSFRFEGLSAGTLYSARVFTCSGPFNASSEYIRNATFPNPPGSVKVLRKTTSSIEVRWEEAPLMKAPSFFYKLTHTPSQGGGYNTSNTSHTLDSLHSGTSYNISIATVGPMDFESEKVHIYMVTTRPCSITGLKVETLNTTTGRLVWSKPLGNNSEYKYRVQTTGCSSQNQTVQVEAANISALTPGTNCTFCVFVIAVDGTEGEENCTSQYTKPETVQVSLSSQGSNSSVLVSWTKPPGNVEHFKVYLNSTSSTLEEKELNSTSNSSRFEGLSAGTLYSARVSTCSGPFNASSEYIRNATFPNPPGSVKVLRKTTSSIEVRWEEAPLMKAPSFFYKLTHTPSQGGGYNTSNTSNTSHTLDSLHSGTSYNISIATVGPMDFESEKVHIYMVTTRPCSITGLKVEALNTTTGHLVWSEPLGYNSEYKYRVQTTGCSSQNQTVQVKAANISALTPGTNCTFCVFVIAVDGTEGEENCTSQYTKPETVQVSLSSQGSNSSVLVSWTKPPGKVEYFKVYLNSTSSTLEEKELSSTSNSSRFEGLSAGTLYSARVFTCSGPFNASSEYIHNATFPNPPGSVEVLRRTTSSIEVRWGEAPLMTARSFFYKLTHTPSQGAGSNPSNTSNTSQTFDSLLPGTSYNISIATVGVMGFESEKIHIYMVTTIELRVESVVACMTQEDNITVKWDPVEYTGSFHYRFTWTNRHGLQNITTQKTNYTIYDLDPGSRHNFSVTPENSDGKPGITTMNSSCTNASPVNNLKCEGPNEPEPKIILSWNKPRGQHSGLRVTANDSLFEILTNTTYNYTVLYPHHNMKYLHTVETLSCGLPSPPVPCVSSTGITVPPIPPNYEKLLTLTGKTHNQFSLQINRELLNDTKGPVTHVGVLVANNPVGVDTSNLNKYIGNTYDQWKKGETQIYLATVKETNPQSRSGENHLNIEVGDQTKWNGYTNGALEATGHYQYAIVLFTNVTLTPGELVNFEKSLASVTELFLSVILPQNPAVIGVAVGATLGIFCILFIILIGFIIYWKRFNRKEPSDIQIQSMRSVAVRIEDYERYYKKQRADSNCGFAEEFEDLKAVGTGQSRTSALTIENKSKNRYNNVLPYDFSRVKLSIIHGSPFDDYINANYMPGYNSRKEFIAAQGPLPITVSDFWRMIWEKNVLTLVMLTRCNEQGRVKCEQYWGFDTKNCENITVTTTSDIPLDDWTIRDFDIKNVKTAETRSVRQFHFTAWPDHGVPETTELLIDFRHLVREHMDQYSRHSPTVVHCSAGVGRTGTFIAIDRLIFQIERDDSVDIYGIVHDQRMHRTLMVQTEDQYVFLNQCAMDIIRSRTGTNVDLIYQNVAALSEYENIKPKKGGPKD
ncbi:receptor-type tyrosine-protein phosphatase eta isoform X2 [Platichthys flesus]|uniref:receptor-type tyrosine-protein phosphatase eta isoform X2 n=1 Tax=Platichthys flesus TaxID=8260 RepID=UPI002DB9B95A|nr:receptor-type tyrosine-protein phosphatase eta isoform X2 [Platichthys flesus]